jgi:hypothetical protein
MKMNKRPGFTKTIFFQLITITILLAVSAVLAACGPTVEVQAMAEDVDVPVQAAFDYAAAADNHAFRWKAMAEAYERHGMLNYHDNPDDLSAYRWLAMARAYERLGMLNDALDPGDVMAFRWNAMAEAYAQRGLLNYHDNPDDLSAYRWLAMARAYERLGMLNDK